VPIGKYATILPGQLNPDLAPKLGTPIARPSNITDDPMAVLRRTQRNVVAPNVFEGVNTFRGVVLCAYRTPAAQFDSLMPTDDKEGVAYRCMIPELHLCYPNPFAANSLDEFNDISIACYPIYEVPQTLVEQVGDSLNPGSVVEVRFDDPNKSIGYVIATAHKAAKGLLEELGNSARDALVDSILSPGESITEFPASTREANATSEEILSAYPAAGPEMAAAIVDAAEDLGMDPAHLANLIAGESNGTFDPAVQNPPGCVAANATQCAVGPIQIIRSTAAELGTTPEELSNMSKVEYMKYVKRYFELDRIQNAGDGGGFGTQDRVNMAVFHPPAVGAGASYDIYSDWVQEHGREKADEILEANHGLETAGDYYNIVSRKWEIDP
jgi:hypothetical protein